MHLCIHTIINNEIYSPITRAGIGISENVAHHEAIVELLNSLCLLYI